MSNPPILSGNAIKSFIDRLRGVPAKAPTNEQVNKSETMTDDDHIFAEKHSAIVGYRTRNAMIRALGEGGLSSERIESATTLLRDPTLTVGQLYFSDAFANLMLLNEDTRLVVCNAMSKDTELKKEDFKLLLHGMSYTSNITYANESINAWRLKNMYGVYGMKRDLNKTKNFE